MNALEVILVTDYLVREGIENYTMRQGNECIWVSHGRVEMYFIIRDGKIIDIQVD